jgi:hypothetical protein
MNERMKETRLQTRERKAIVGERKKVSKTILTGTYRLHSVEFHMWERKARN